MIYILCAGCWSLDENPSGGQYDCKFSQIDLGGFGDHLFDLACSSRCVTASVIGAEGTSAAVALRFLADRSLEDSASFERPRKLGSFHHARVHRLA